MPLPSDAKERKAVPLATGVLDYFPDALAAVAAVSKAGNDQHNPGEPLHWAKEKSTDHADCLLRHLTERGTVDDDGTLHSAKVAWRALALLQIEIETARAKQLPLTGWDRIGQGQSGSMTLPDRTIAINTTDGDGDYLSNVEAGMV